MKELPSEKRAITYEDEYRLPAFDTRKALNNLKLAYDKLKGNNYCFLCKLYN